ncbi:MAG: hypothetical protein EOP53_16535 [Sphingobacteriales bacterium]|nr:MAG: hypothetical protein EOP53_16535 [Sphingobacteriales bacterium]
MLIYAPAFFLIGAYFWFCLLQIKSKVKYPIAINLALLLLIVLPARYGIERIKPFANREETVSSKNAKMLGSKIPKDEKAVVFNAGNYIEAMFYSGQTVYPIPPTKQEIDSLQKEGFSIYIIQDENNKSQFQNQPKVKYIRYD